MKLKQNYKSLLCLLIGASLSSPSFADTRTWLGSNGFNCNSSFTNGFCWTPLAVPNFNDIAVFSSTGSALVNFDSTRGTSNVGALVTGTTSFWQLNRQKYRLTSVLNVTNNAQLFLGDTGGKVSVLGELSISGNSRLFNNAGSGLSADSIILQSNARLFSNNGAVGGSAGTVGTSASGNVTVTGSGSQWNLADELTVLNGSRLTVADRGFVDVGDKLTIEVAGSASTTGGGRIEAASLSVENSGDLFSTSGLVGATSNLSGNVSSIGNAVVTGNGSEWDTGTLTVTNGRSLTVSNHGFVDVANTLTIQSGGSAVMGNGRIEAGNITLHSGGILNSIYSSVGSSSTTRGSASSIGDAVVTGGGSQWDTATSFTVTNGRDLSVSSSGFVDVGQTLFIEKAGRALTTAGGRIEAGNVSIHNSGDLFSTTGLVGATTTATGSANSIGNASVTGVGSEWDATGIFTVTNRGILTVADGGFVDVGDKLTIQNTGSVVTTRGGRIEVGSLTIQSGGDLFSSSGLVGAATTVSGSANSLGNALVTGSGSLWDTEDTLKVSNGRSLTIADGGLVDVGGRLTIQTAGSASTTSGGQINAGSIAVRDGGKLFSNRSSVGGSTALSGSANAIGNSVVTGAGSQWDIDGSLTVLNGSSLVVAASGFVDVDSRLDILGGSRVLTITGGRIEADSFNIQSGGVLSSVSGFVGSSSTANGSASSINSNAFVTGTGSQWNTGTLTVMNSRSLTVASAGLVDVSGLLSIQDNARARTTTGGRIEAGSLNIESGADLISTSGFVGASSTANGSASSIGDVLVTGAGSTWDTDTLTVMNEASLHTIIGGLVNVSNMLTIQGAGRASATGGGLIKAGGLTVQSGGKLFSNNGFVGSSSSATGSISSSGNATVTGLGSQWVTNSLSVNNGKRLSVTDNASVIVRQNLAVNSGAELQINNARVNTENINVTGSSSVLNMTNATVNANVNITNASLTGTGTINGNVTGISAEFGPGNSPGLLTIDGDFSQDINSSILFELAGVIAESEYDVLDISGTANLAGELVIDWFDNGGGLFGASEGDFFDILFAETIIGEFDLLTLAVLGEGLGWDLSYLIDEFGSTDVLRLSVIDTSAVPVPAAVWLFGSGLLGLVGVARRKQA